MARGRMIDKRVSNSKKIGKISDKAKVLWFMLLPHLDREGRISFDDLDDLKVEIMPNLRDFSLKKIGNALNELADIGLIYLYPDKNRIAIQYKKFEDFQIGLRKDREAESGVVPYGVAPESSGNFRILAPKFKLKEVKGRKEVILILFNVETGEFENITEKDLERWKKTYPACDINQELLFMADWLMSNPDKIKVNYPRFISNWLKKTQDSGGTKKSRGTMTKKEQYMKEQKKKFLERDKNDKQN